MNINDNNITELGLTPKKLIGTVSCKMRDADGNIVFEDTVHNNVLLNVRHTIIRLLAGSAYNGDIDKFPYVKFLSVGASDKSTPDSLILSPDKNELIEPIEGTKVEVRMATLAGTDLPDKIDTNSPSVTFAFLYNASFPALEADGVTIKEMGLWDAENRLIARTTVGGWQKRPGIYFEVYWTIGYAN